MHKLILFLAFSGLAFGQCGPLAINPVTLELNCTGTGSSGAPTNATYLTLSTNATLTNERVLTAGTGISFTDGGAGSTLTVATSAAVPLKIATGAKALATGAIASGACTSAQTDTATGTLTTDVIVATFAADPTALTGYTPPDMLSIVAYPTADTVNFKVCNNTANSITPQAVTINWKVIR